MRLLASCAGGIVVHQCPDPERLLALAGQVRVLEHNWELDYYGPRGLAKARMGDRPRIDPEQVRQAQPGEAWVIQAGQSIHLRVLPPPAGSPESAEPAASIPLVDDAISVPAQEPAPVGIAAAVALAGHVVRRAGQRVGRRRSGPGGCPRRSGGRGCPCGPCQGGADDEVPSDEPRDVEVVIGHGIGVVLARTWSGDRFLERALKRRRMAPRYCSICHAECARRR
jgi:hypothetical protein